MDNNYENGFYGQIPQKPFTDKSANNASSLPVDSDSGEREVKAPEMTESSCVSESNSDYEQTVVNNTAMPFNQPQTAYQHSNAQWNNQYGNYPNPNSYGGYNYAGQYPQNNGGFAGGQNIPPQGYSAPPQGYSVPPQGYSAPPQPPVAPKKNKVSVGLVVVVLSMFALIAVGFVGMTVYLSKSIESDSSNPYEYFDEFFKEYGSGDNDDSFDFTIPNEDDSPEIKENAHPESDYSDKTDKDFAGITLNNIPKDAKSDKYNTKTANAKASDSVVGVVCFQNDETDIDSASQGSGIIITKDGYIATNSHVIGDSKTGYEIQVVLSDGKTYEAGVVGFDKRSDIAVLKLKNAPKNLTVAEFGNSDNLELGEEIIAIGNPGGIKYQNSITKGVVSALDREAMENSLVDFIQVDAAINPGNSGGPIVNVYGQVVGISTAKVAAESYEGMGFAIPSVTAKDIIDSLIRNSYVEGRVKIGIMGNAVGSDQSLYQSDVKGILVVEIVEGGPCDNTDLKEDDIVTKVGNEEIETFGDIYKALENYKPGDKVKLSFYRPSDKSTHEIEIVLQEDK